MSNIFIPDFTLFDQFGKKPDLISKWLDDIIDCAFALSSSWITQPPCSTATGAKVTPALTWETLNKCIGAIEKDVIEPTISSMINVISSPYCQIREQYRFPKTRKKRILKKWAKDERYFRVRPVAYLIKGKDLVVHPSIAARMRRDMAVRIDNFSVQEIMK